MLLSLYALAVATHPAFAVFVLCLSSRPYKDKRRAVGARTHAAAKDREDAADGLDMKESDTMGGSDSFRETLARAQHGKQRRQMAKTVRVSGVLCVFESLFVFSFCVARHVR